MKRDYFGPFLATFNKESNVLVAVPNVLKKQVSTAKKFIKDNNIG
jgi:hypothetical protein